MYFFQFSVIMLGKYLTQNVDLKHLGNCSIAVSAYLFFLFIAQGASPDTVVTTSGGQVRSHLCTYGIDYVYDKAIPPRYDANKIKNVKKG